MLQFAQVAFWGILAISNKAKIIERDQSAQNSLTKINI